MPEIFAREFSAYGPIAAALMDWRLWLLLMIAIVAATTVHEFGHAWMADRLGDPGPREEGRVSLNPLRHLDPIGTLVMAVTTFIGFPLGWGRPVKTDPDAFTKASPRVGMAYVALAGPVMNLVLAICLAPIIRLLFLSTGAPLSGFSEMLFPALLVTLAVNVSLFVFNLTPIHPLDGSHILTALLPEKASQLYVSFMKRYGVFVLLFLMLPTGPGGMSTLGKALGPIILWVMRLLLGR